MTDETEPIATEGSSEQRTLNAAVESIPYSFTESTVSEIIIVRIMLCLQIVNNKLNHAAALMNAVEF
jgi:hypothetical protein